MKNNSISEQKEIPIQKLKKSKAINVTGGRSHGGGGGKDRGVPGGEEATGDPKANAMDGQPGAKPQKRKKKKSTGKQGIGPKKAAGAKGKKPDSPKAGGEKQQDGESEVSQDEKQQQSLERAGKRLMELDRFVPIPGGESDGTFFDLEKATGTKDFEEKFIDVFDNSQWMLFYKHSDNPYYINYNPGGPQADVINSIFGAITPKSGEILNMPQNAFQYIIALKMLLRIKFQDRRGKSIVKMMNKKLETISKDLSDYYSIIKDNPKTKFDRDLNSSVNKAKIRMQKDAAYAKDVPDDLKNSIAEPSTTAVADQPTRPRESKIMNKNDVKELIKEAFIDRVYGKYPYSHQSGDSEEPKEDYIETWKKFCLEIVQDKTKERAISLAKILVKDLELFEDVLDLAGQNQSVGSEILKKMEKAEKEMV